jgi:protocatechuate 3,4-dioxygenase beta subunit
MRRGRTLLILVVVLLLSAGVAALVARDRPQRPGSPSPATADPAKACEPTRGEPSQGTGAIAADAPSRTKLGPGVEVERTAETVAAGRGGRRLLVSGTVYAAGCTTPLVGASLEVWQTNADGEYGPGHGSDDDRCCYLAAALRTDAGGRYQFETVMPGHYKGEQRPPPAHIHFEVRHPDAAGLLTELLFAGDPWLGPDPGGEIVQPTELAGSDPPALQARFDIVLPPG